MSAKTSFSCNLCRKEIERVELNEKHGGLALKWVSDFGNKREDLEATHDWVNCPLHLCRECILAAGRLCFWLQNSKTIGVKP